MTVRWDPKVGSVERLESPKGPQSTAPSRPETPAAEPKTRGLPSPAMPATHPGRQQMDAARTPLERDIQSLRKQLHAPGPERREAAAQALALCRRYPLRRSRGGRQMALELCDEVATQTPDSKHAARRLAAWLDAEGDLHVLDPHATSGATHALVVLLEDNAAEADSKEFQALTRAALANALIQLAVHFPSELNAAKLDSQTALSQAVVLAEEAIILAPELPDGHAALGRALLCHDDPDALDDAAVVLTHAAGLDPQHDPTLAGLAAVYLARGDTERALACVHELQRHGNALPHVALLRAMVFAASDRLPEARQELERATRIAPKAGLLWRERAALAASQEEAREHEARAHSLLGV